jgi:hypothetical protein
MPGGRCVAGKVVSAPDRLGLADGEWVRLVNSPIPDANDRAIPEERIGRMEPGVICLRMIDVDLSCLC